MADKCFMITSDRIGRGDDELGRVLMKSFIYSLARAETRPMKVCFMNSGVSLVCEGSEVLDDLRLMEEAGVLVSACGTCLDYMHLKDKIAVGAVGTMPDSVATMTSSVQIVTIA
jgi:selenium metabolism protein YedF